MNCPHGVPCDDEHTCSRCCAHREVFLTGECAACGDQRDACPPDVIVARLGRCEHVNQAIQRGGDMWCPDCGARRGRNWKDWTLPRFVAQAKQLDDYWRLGMGAPEDDDVDSDQKNVVPTKTGT